MNWNQAQKAITDALRPGTNVNTARSKYRSIKAMNKLINSKAYGYNGESGFEIWISDSSDVVKIPWSMLEYCFREAKKPEGYTGASFRFRYPRQAANKPCHIHVVGRMLEVSGVAQYDGKAYLA